MPLPLFSMLLLLLSGWVDRVAGIERIECTQHADCKSKSLACCRNNICCSSRYHQKWRTKCFSHYDCKGIKDHFTKMLMNEHCCKSNECCSIHAFENEPDEVKGNNGHTKFLIIVCGTLLATAILIATIVTFWCSSDKIRSRRRRFSFQTRNPATSIFETSPDENMGDIQTSCLAIDQEGAKPKSTNYAEDTETVQLTNSEQKPEPTRVPL